MLRDGFMPQIRIKKVEIYGPLKNFSSDQQLSAAYWWSDLRKEEIPHHIEKFATQAFRRPVSSTDLKEFHALFQFQSKSGRTLPEAYKDVLKAILCSPKFLYFSSEKQETAARKKSKEDFSARFSGATFLFPNLINA